MGHDFCADSFAAKLSAGHVERLSDDNAGKFPVHGTFAQMQL